MSSPILNSILRFSFLSSGGISVSGSFSVSSSMAASCLAAELSLAKSDLVPFSFTSPAEEDFSSLFLSSFCSDRFPDSAPAAVSVSSSASVPDSVSGSASVSASAPASALLSVSALFSVSTLLSVSASLLASFSEGRVRPSGSSFT